MGSPEHADPFEYHEPLDQDEMEQALTSAFGVETYNNGGDMCFEISKNIELFVTLDDREAGVFVGFPLDGCRPGSREGFEIFLANMKLLTNVADKMINLGFTPYSWNIGEDRGPNLVNCSISMSRPLRSKAIPEFVEEVRSLKSALEALVAPGKDAQAPALEDEGGQYHAPEDGMRDPSPDPFDDTHCSTTDPFDGTRGSASDSADSTRDPK